MGRYTTAPATGPGPATGAHAGPPPSARCDTGGKADAGAYAHPIPPADPGLIPLTAEVKRVFNLITRTWQTNRRYLHWSWWRRRHQASARWFHQRARLCRQAAGP